MTECLIETKPIYLSSSHTFNWAIITAYNNLLNNEHERTSNYILVKQTRKDTLFLLNPEFDFRTLKRNKPLSVVSEISFDGFREKVTEIEYDLEELFKHPTKQVRRGMNIRDREELVFKESNSAILYEMLNIFNSWKGYKQNDKAVFQIAFNPNRYLRTYALKSLGFKIYEKIIYVKTKPYAVINFSLEGDKAFELSFVSRFFDKELRFINDLNECILISCFYDLYKNYGIKTIRPGRDGGIKGLKFFKNQFKGRNSTIYSLTIK